MNAQGRLSILSINDVYSLENFPRLKSLVRDRAQASQGSTFLVVLAGDFLAPSLLSSIDAGRGMVECLNAIGVDYVILGNHEDDLPIAELRARLGELRAVCLGTNVGAGLPLPHSAVIDVGGVKVGLVGVVMTDPAAYRGKPFGGVDLFPANDAAIDEALRLEKSGCSFVVPLTHQTIAEDRALARRKRAPSFPVIVGGHEHTPMLVQEEGTWIVKAGMDAAHAVLTEIAWAQDPSSCSVKTELLDVAPYPEDNQLRRRVDHHMGRVKELAGATLVRLPPDTVLSSIGTRQRQTSMGTLVCTKLRDVLECQACVFNGGGIRGSHEYKAALTYSDLETEIPFSNEVVVVSLTGAVIRDAVEASRAHAPAESGGFLQVDDRMVVEDGRLVAIDGSPLDPSREYTVAMVRELLLGLDHVEPLIRWAATNPTGVPPAGSGREPKLLLVQAFAWVIWQELGGFDAIDVDKDERVTAAEIAAAIARVHPEQPVSQVLVDLVIRALDRNFDHVISRDEAAQVKTGGHR